MHMISLIHHILGPNQCIFFAFGSISNNLLSTHFIHKFALVKDIYFISLSSQCKDTLPKST